ncbi:hypothetical protein [Pseudomonas sp. PLMAX]|uniref:hypothetical protein n=1 Tax=Pseudomonas sp. PLMAX TaxID=2201998 RepID=UPI0038B70575
MVDIVPTKKPATQKDNVRELKNLMSFFLTIIQRPWRQSSRFTSVSTSPGVGLRQFERTERRPCSGIKVNKETFTSRMPYSRPNRAVTFCRARDQLGHTTVVMTEQYIRNRKGKKVSPTK